MALLEIKNLTVAFDTSTGAFKAVDGIDISVDAGEVLAIVGESGSGKSVGMLAVMGLLPKTATVTADKMVFDGRDLLKMSDKERRAIIGREISMIFQEPIASLNPCFTVGFQLEEVLRFHLGMGKAQRRARAIELLELVGIRDAGDRLGSYPHQMSGGQCQRVMIAIAIACNPKLLIADEPTTALDVTIQKQILDLLMRLQEEHGMGLIMITHDMGVIRAICDRVLVLDRGQVQEVGKVWRVFGAPQAKATQALLRPLQQDLPPDLAQQLMSAPTEPLDRAVFSLRFAGSRHAQGLPLQALAALGPLATLLHGGLDRLDGHSLGQLLISAPVANLPSLETLHHATGADHLELLGYVRTN